MVVRIHVILAAAVWLGVGNRLNAGPYLDIASAPRFRVADAGSENVASSGADRLSVADLAENDLLLLSVPPDGGQSPHLELPSAKTRAASGNHQGGDVARVAEIPQLPGSAELFLSALVSMGAWHLVRQSRNARIETMPEWYQTGRPIQVRHIVALDVTSFAQPLPPMYLACQTTREMSVPMGAGRLRMAVEWSGTVVGPRAPPLDRIRALRC